MRQQQEKWWRRTLTMPGGNGVVSVLGESSVSQSVPQLFQVKTRPLGQPMTLVGQRAVFVGAKNDQKVVSQKAELPEEQPVASQTNVFVPGQAARKVLFTAFSGAESGQQPPKVMSLRFKALEEQVAENVYLSVQNTHSVDYVPTELKVEKSVVRRSSLKQVRLTHGGGGVYRSAAVRQKFVPSLSGLSFETVLKAEAEQPITVELSTSLTPKKTNNRHNGQFEIVKIIAGELRESSRRWSAKRRQKTQQARQGHAQSAQKGGWLDKLSTLVIGAALAVSLVYLGPWLTNNVLKLGTGRTTRSQTEITSDREAGETEEKAVVEAITEELMNDNAVTFLKEDLPSVVEVPETVMPFPVISEPVYIQPTFPEFNPALPTGEWIRADKIGLNGRIHSDADVEKALAEGVVQISGYGEVGVNNGLPVILAAHRFGYKWWWKSNYARENSFYYLPELQMGDRVAIVKDQRKWYYEIYDSYEGTEIDSYQADLILYTCRYLNADVRYFKYARLIDPSQYGELGLI